MNNAEYENFDLKSSQYELERKRENEKRLSDNIYRIEYEHYLKRKNDSECKLKNALAAVREKRERIDSAITRRNSVNSCGIYSHRKKISAGKMVGIWCGAIFVGSTMFPAMEASFGPAVFDDIWPIFLVFGLIIVITSTCLTLYGMITGARNKSKLLANIEESIEKDSAELQKYERVLADAQAEYQMIIKSEPKRENY